MLQRLHPRDRFNLITFASETARLFHASRFASAENLAHARQFVESLEPNGSTEILPALTLALDNPVHSNYFKQIVVLTDGAMGPLHHRSTPQFV